MLIKIFGPMSEHHTKSLLLSVSFFHGYRKEDIWVYGERFHRTQAVTLAKRHSYALLGLCAFKFIANPLIWNNSNGIQVRLWSDDQGMRRLKPSLARNHHKNKAEKQFMQAKTCHVLFYVSKGKVSQRERKMLQYMRVICIVTVFICAFVHLSSVTA